MSRKKTLKKRQVLPDSVYDSCLITMFINRILKKGKKNLAQKIFDQSMIEIQESTKLDPIEVLQEAITNVTPTMEVKSKRIGGSTYQVPKEVSSERGTTLALRWILQAAKNRPERGMILKLSHEIIDASKKSGSAVRKRDETHRMAESNKAYAHFKY